jgi:hypothetical protein
VHKRLKESGLHEIAFSNKEAKERGTMFLENHPLNVEPT